MATKTKSASSKITATGPYDWNDGDGAIHSIPLATHLSDVAAQHMTSPPPGTYDPALDAAEFAAARGLTYTQQDLDTSNTRADQALRQGTEQNNVQRQWSLDDALTSKTNNEADLATVLSQEQAQSGVNRAAINKNYTDLGNAQAGAVTHSGIVDTGAIKAASGVRAGNKQTDVTAQDTADEQAQTAYNTGMTRQDSAYTTAQDRTNETYDWANAGLTTTDGYTTDDNATSLSRALNENTFYGQDEDAEKEYEATSSGLYTLPSGSTAPGAVVTPATTAAKSTTKKKKAAA